jgi:hypothetical protein
MVREKSWLREELLASLEVRFLHVGIYSISQAFSQPAISLSHWEISPSQAFYFHYTNIGQEISSRIHKSYIPVA